MKHYILSLFTLAALVVGAQAQGIVTAGPVTVYNSVSSNVVAGTLVLDVRRQQNVAVEWTQQLGGAGTGVGALYFYPSLDGSTVATSPEIQGYYMLLAASGTTATRAITNFNVKGYNYLMLGISSNANAQYMTNTIRYWVKPNAP